MLRKESRSSVCPWANQSNSLSLPAAVFPPITAKGPSLSQVMAPVRDHQSYFSAKQKQAVPLSTPSLAIHVW